MAISASLGHFFPYRGFLIGILCLLPLWGLGQQSDYHFDYNLRMKRAYQSSLRLDFSTATKLIMTEIREDPYNLMATYLADYRDCLELLLSGDPRQLEKKVGNLNQRIQLLDRGPRSDPWYQMTKAGIHLRWAIVYIRFGENLKGLVQLRKAYQMIKASRTSHPEFIYGDLFEGIERVLVGTLPSSYKWLERILGIRGDIPGGARQIEAFIKKTQEGDLFNKEARFFLLYIKWYIQADPSGVNHQLDQALFMNQEEWLAQLIRADILIHARQAERARKGLEPLISSGQVAGFPIFDYLMGIAYLHAMDPRAEIHLKDFVRKNQGVFYEKEAHRLLALLAYLEGDMARAQSFRSQIGKLGGNAYIDVDRRADRFFQESRWPHPDLLRVQWLSDGGYIKEAQGILNALDPKSMDRKEDQLTYFYRKGWLLEVQKDYIKSLKAYAQAIDLGKNSSEQYGARAALQSARVYEKMGNLDAARTMYKTCLSMKNHDFQNSIDQQAKAGLERLH